MSRRPVWRSALLGSWGLSDNYASLRRAREATSRLLHAVDSVRLASVRRGKSYMFIALDKDVGST